MVTGYETIVLGTQILYLRSLTRNKVAGTRKQKLGGALVRHGIPARTTRDWEISAQGVMFDTSSTGHDPFPATTQWKSLEGYDDIEKRQYSDGLITGSFVITNLQFQDSDESPLTYEYTISLIEYNQW